MQEMDWDDLRMFCDAAEGPTLAAAARRLGVSIATVARRISALESALGVRLLDRARNGVTLTTQGRVVLARARAAAAAMEDVGRLATALRASAWPDPIRVSATEPIISEILAPALPALLAAAPEIRVDLTSTNEVVRIAAREADIAVRFARPIGDSLIVRRLPGFDLGLFAAKSYLGDRQPADLDLTRERLLGFDDSYGRIAEVVWMEQSGLGAAIVARSSSTRALINAAVAGAGIAPVARLFARARPTLVEIPTRLPIPRRPAWLVSHRDLRQARPVRMVREWIVETFRRALTA